MLLAIGLGAATLTIASFVAQTRKIVKTRDVSSLSAPMWILSTTAFAVWTLYGALLANGVCLPLADKLSYLNKQELIDMEIVVKGILGIQSGDNPRLIEQRLGMYLPAGEREALRRPRVRPEVEEDVLV